MLNNIGFWDFNLDALPVFKPELNQVPTLKPEQFVPVYGDDRRPVPFLFKSTLTGRFKFMPPEPGTERKTVPEPERKWIRDVSPYVAGWYESSTAKTPREGYFRFFDGISWFGRGTEIYNLLNLHPEYLQDPKSMPVCVRSVAWRTLSAEQRKQLSLKP